MNERTAQPLVLWTLVLLLALDAGCADKPTVGVPEDDSRRTVEDVIPLTLANMRGHRMLYNEGWFVITSTRHAFEYAKAHSVISSNQALHAAQHELARHSTQYKDALQAGVKDSLDSGTRRLRGATQRSGKILNATGALAESELVYGREQFVKAWQGLVRGYLTLAPRTEEDRTALIEVPGRWFDGINRDFSNVWQVTKSLHERMAGQIEVSWDASFKQAGQDFREEYERSGEEGNTLLALGPILQGYLKAFYHGAAVPTAKTLVHAGAASTAYATSAVFLPAADTSIVAGRTIQSIGLTVFYVGDTGYKLISPTLESGLLNGLAMLSVGAVPLTYVAGGALGAVNQVAFTAGAPLYTAGEAATWSALQTGRYAGFVAYDMTTGATKVIINQASSGMVLGYNALSAIPAHLLMGVTDSVILLAWEGPNLVIAKVTGRVKPMQGIHRETENRQPFSVGDLPAGAVLDLKQLKEADGLRIEILSRDPAVIRNVIPQISCDMRESDAPCQQ